MIVSYGDVVKVFTGPVEMSRWGREFQPADTFKVDAVNGDTVTLMVVSLSEGPFFRTMDRYEIEAMVDAGDGEFIICHTSRFAPRGECGTCDRQREAESTFFPAHDAGENCRSGRHNHCTCDLCF